MHIIVTATLSLHAGAVVGLTEEQAARRAPFIKALPKRRGWYEVLAEIQFKRGEGIQYDGDVPKGLGEVVEAPKRKKGAAVDEDAEAKAKAAADADAKAKADADAAASGGDGGDDKPPAP